jgi:hypothetical protein
MRRLVFGVLLACAVGCGHGESNVGKKVVPMDQVPEVVLKAAREKLTDVKFDEVWQKPNGDYEVRDKNKQGKVREVEVNPKGEVVAVE